MQAESSSLTGKGSRDENCSEPGASESVLAGTDQALILRLNLQARPIRLAHYELRHPCLYNEHRQQQDRLLPNRDMLKLTKGARAMVLFLVSIRRRELEDRGQATAPGFTWEGPPDSPAACLAEALHLSTQGWLKSWFGFFPPKISRTKSLSSMLFPHSNGAGKPASVSLRSPATPARPSRASARSGRTASASSPPRPRRSATRMSWEK